MVTPAQKPSLPRGKRRAPLSINHPPARDGAHAFRPARRGASGRAVPRNFGDERERAAFRMLFLPRRRLMHVPPLAPALPARCPQLGPAAVMGNRQRAADSEGGA